MSSSTPPENLAVLAAEFRGMREDIREIKDVLRSNVVTQTEFEPVKRLVYGLVGTILLSVAGAVLALVLKT